jgi:hypothetical protein
MDAWDLMASSGWGCRNARGGAARLRGEVSPEAWTRPLWGSRALGKGSGEPGWHGGLSRGHDTDIKALDGTVWGGGARRRRSSIWASDCADNMALNGKLRAWGVCSPREGTLERLSNSEDAERPWVDDRGAPTAWWGPGECEPRELGELCNTPGVT